MEVLNSLMVQELGCHRGIFNPSFKQFGVDSHAEPQVIYLGLMDFSSVNL